MCYLVLIYSIIKNTIAWLWNIVSTHSSEKAAINIVLLTQILKPNTQFLPNCPTDNMGKKNFRDSQWTLETIINSPLPRRQTSASLAYVSFYYSNLSTSPSYPASKKNMKMQLLIPTQATIICVLLGKEVLWPDNLYNNSIYNVIFWLCTGSIGTENQYHQNEGHF